MKLASLLLLFALGCATTTQPAGSTPVAATAKPAVHLGIGKAFKGPEGLLLHVVALGPPEAEEVLLKYSNVDHPWNGKVWKAKKVLAGTGFDYQIQWEGADYHTVVSRGGSSWPSYQVYLPKGPDGAHVHYDEAASKDVDTAKLYGEYLAQTGGK